MLSDYCGLGQRLSVWDRMTESQVIYFEFMQAIKRCCVGSCSSVDLSLIKKKNTKVDKHTVFIWTMDCEVLVVKGYSSVSPKEKKVFWKRTVVFMCKWKFFLDLCCWTEKKISDVQHWDENNHSATGDSQVNAEYWYRYCLLKSCIRNLSLKNGSRTCAR